VLSGNEILEFSHDSSLVMNKKGQRYTNKLQLQIMEQLSQTIAEFSAGKGRMLSNPCNPMDGYKDASSFDPEHLLTKGFTPQHGLYQAMADRLNTLTGLSCCTGANIGIQIRKLRGANNSEVSARWHACLIASSNPSFPLLCTPP
jgi:hypothetical protein